MTSKQRVFSHDTTIDYIEYIKNKQGVENLKTIKNNDNNVMLNKFASYEQFINLSKSYYKYNALDCCIIQPTQNLYNSNISYINQTQHRNKNNHSTQTKNKECDCGVFTTLHHLEENGNKNDNDNHDECKLLKHVLYPYGHYNTNKQSDMYFPYKLDLDKWCSKKKPCPNPFDYHYNDDIKEVPPDKHCKTGLCRNPKPLFI